MREALRAAGVLHASPHTNLIGGGARASWPKRNCSRRTASEMLQWLGGYIDRSEILVDLNHYVVPPMLGAARRVLGALVSAIGAAGNLIFEGAVKT